MAATIRGDNAHIIIVEDGERLPIFEIVNFEASSKTEEHESFFVGRKDPETDALERGWTGSFTVEVKSAVIDDLMNRIMTARRSRVAPPDVRITMIEDYVKADTPESVRSDLSSKTFLDCQLIYANLRTGGLNEKITKTIGFNASKMILNLAG